MIKIFTSTLLTLILSIIVFQSCKDKTKTTAKENLIQKQINSTNDSLKAENSEEMKTIKVGYYDIFEKLPKFIIDSTTAFEFDQQKTIADFETNKIERKQGFFYIQTSNEKLKFKEIDENSIGNASLNGNEYFGFDKKLKMYSVEKQWVSDDLGFAEMTLIDSITNYKYKIISLGDWSVSVPKPSTTKKFMVYYQNPEYESETLSIAVLKITNENRNVKFITEYKSCFIDNGLSIEEIRWKDDNTFFLKLYKSKSDVNGNEIKEYKYFVAKI